MPMQPATAMPGKTERQSERDGASKDEILYKLRKGHLIHKTGPI